MGGSEKEGRQRAGKSIKRRKREGKTDPLFGPKFVDGISEIYEFRFPTAWSGPINLSGG